MIALDVERVSRARTLPSSSGEGEVVLRLPSLSLAVTSRALRLPLDEQRTRCSPRIGRATPTSGASAAASFATTWRGR